MRNVIDTNVLIAANGRSNTHASVRVELESARFLAAIIQGDGTVLEDSSSYVFDEYKRYMQFSGQPGIGDKFFRWFLTNRYSSHRVESVPLEPDRPVSTYLPDELRAFDPSDHKWIAIYLEGHGDRIVNATDSDWAEAADALAKHGVSVLQLDREDD